MGEEKKASTGFVTAANPGPLTKLELASGTAGTNEWKCRVQLEARRNLAAYPRTPVRRFLSL